MLEVRSTERVLPVVQAFMETEEYQTYVEDAEVSMRIVAHNVVQVRRIKQCVWNNMFTVHVCRFVYLQGVLSAEERLR